MIFTWCLMLEGIFLHGHFKCCKLQVAGCPNADVLSAGGKREYVCNGMPTNDLIWKSRRGGGRGNTIKTRKELWAWRALEGERREEGEAWVWQEGRTADGQWACGGSRWRCLGPSLIQAFSIPVRMYKKKKRRQSLPYISSLPPSHSPNLPPPSLPLTPLVSFSPWRAAGHPRTAPPCIAS